MKNLNVIVIGKEYCLCELLRPQGISYVAIPSDMMPPETEINRPPNNVKGFIGKVTNTRDYCYTATPLFKAAYNYTDGSIRYKSKYYNIVKSIIPYSEDVVPYLNIYNASLNNLFLQEMLDKRTEQLEKESFSAYCSLRYIIENNIRYCYVEIDEDIDNSTYNELIEFFKKTIDDFKDLEDRMASGILNINNWNVPVDCFRYILPEVVYTLKEYAKPVYGVHTYTETEIFAVMSMFGYEVKLTPLDFRGLFVTPFRKELLPLVEKVSMYNEQTDRYELVVTFTNNVVAKLTPFGWTYEEFNTTLNLERNDEF